MNLALRSPFSISSALKFGVLFLVLEIAGVLGQRGLGQRGFYVVSVVGGLVSSASSVASDGLLASHGTLLPQVAGIGAVLASLASAFVDLPVIARIGRDPCLTRRLGLTVALISACLAWPVRWPVPGSFPCRRHRSFPIILDRSWQVSLLRCPKTRLCPVVREKDAS